MVCCWYKWGNIFLFPNYFFARIFFNCFARVNCFDCDLFNFIVWHLFNFFARVLINCFALVWFNFFARNYTLICIIFVERYHMIFLALIFIDRYHTIFLTIFLSPILFLLWCYDITIKVNVCSVIKMCSILFRIRCTTFGFFMTTINMFSHVSVNGLYFLYIRFVHIHNLFHLTDDCFLWCTCTFEGWGAYFFTAFINTNIAIPFPFFLFICAQSILFVLYIIRTPSLFIFIRVCSRFVVAFQFLIFYCLVDVSNCFVDARFKKFGLNVTLSFHWLSNLFY